MPRHFLSRWLVALLIACVLTPAFATHAPTGLQRDVVFNVAPPLARNSELLRRLASPQAMQRIKHTVANDPGVLNALPLDPARQHFALYVPAGSTPPGGYALLVFVPPWDTARVPVQWLPTLDRAHMIFVTAAHSGNDANVRDRREPLALLGAYGVMQRYPVDPAHVYVGGFSGGSRIALRLALGYPDLFRGALLDAGSDPIGTTQIPLPPQPLLHRFQQSSRIVFLTGADDLVRQAQLARAGDSLKRWCVFNVDSITLLHTSHILANAAGFARAVDALTHPTAPQPAKLAVCRATRAGHAR